MYQMLPATIHSTRTYSKHFYIYFEVVLLAILHSIILTLVDGDKSSKWEPPTLQQVADEDVEEYFISPGDNDLRLP